MRARLVAFLVLGFAAPALWLAGGPVASGQPPAGQALSGLERLTVVSEGHPMAVWARRPDKPRGVVLLVHGRTWSSRPDFDLHVPGMQRSVMAGLAARGFATYAVDLRGYGDTPRDATGWLTPRRAASDLINVVTWIAGQHQALPAPAIVGWSRGAMVGMLAAQAVPARVSALVLFGFVFDPDLTFVDVETPAQPLRMKNTTASATSDFITPAVAPKAMIDAFVAAALAADPVLADLKNDGEFNALKPEQVTIPTLVLYGAKDPAVTPADAAKFFSRLATPDKQMVSIPNGAHAAQLEDTHDAWMAAVLNFLSRPSAGR
jgi:pimeloyl-ACP methyl ester carboxylesterase